MTAPIQWFPGHMVTAMRKLEERLALVDIVIEVVDARLPGLSSNPELDRIVAGKPRLIALGREDLADPFATRRWLAWYAAAGRNAIAVDGRTQPSVNRLKAALDAALDPERPARAIVVGIPNTGKSSIINGLVKRVAARTENRAGVTRQLQWFRVNPRLELMDTPGILVPKIPTADAQWMLALTGALPRERYDAEEVADRFADWAARERPRAGIPTIEAFARERGFLNHGDRVDTHNAAGAYLRAYGEGKFGLVTFEDPPAAAGAPLP